MQRALKSAVEVGPAIRGMSKGAIVRYISAQKECVGRNREDKDVRVALTAENLESFRDLYNKDEGSKPSLVFVEGIGTFEVYDVVKSTERMSGKVCVVTGGAQGFGAGIARGIVQNGGLAVVADMNKQGAENMADKLNAEFGEGCALGVEVNVTDEMSVKNMIDAAVLYYGGVDVMVSCAGIVIAGDLTEMSQSAFEKVTSVNYTGYFFCAKYASVPMKIQKKYDSDYMGDIVEINSKSGLEGSKANFAYAGSKFGGIGLTQSFALELAPFGIKVNALCPGNLLDGPLWSDPEKGLFKQYLDAGKVAGAKTVADVRKFYESKVPLGRGCTEGDVVIALMYVVEQRYETGQALPVTGGQVMLS